MAEHEKVMCPSSKATKGARLLGVRQDEGSIAILPQTLKLDDSFIEIASLVAPAEQRFRFTNKCIESGCSQWTGSRCGVSDQIVSVIDHFAPSTELPACEIRPSCRWFLQNGADACKVCVYVVTETTEKEWDIAEMLTAQSNLE